MSKNNVSGHPALGPNLSWWSPRVKGIVAPHVRDHLRVSTGTPGALSTTAYPSATNVCRLIPWRGSINLLVPDEGLHECLAEMVEY